MNPGSMMPSRSPQDPWGGRSPRRWRVPPALLRNPSAPETLEGERILAEHPGASGLLLWQCYRDARLWADTPPKLRPELFPRTDSCRWRETMEAARLDPETLGAVQTLHAALRGSGDDGSTVPAALRIAAAAERAGAAATTVAYTQLAAAAAPAAAAPALAVGRVVARVGHSVMAETWLRRTVALARRSGAWGCYGEALIELGRLKERDGRLREARAEYRMAFRLARRRGLHEIHARAMSGLLRIALAEEDPAAERYARSALRSHGQGHPDRGAVLLDAAEVELRRGGHLRAAELLREAFPSRTDPVDQVRALTMLVRAAGGAGDRAAVQEAWHQATGLIDAFASGAAGARLLLALARAGAEVLEDVHADVAASRALHWATRAGDAALVDECSAFLARTRLPPAHTN
jgi:tetratricopeptide (TPR) repeat protein